MHSTSTGEAANDSINKYRTWSVLQEIYSLNRCINNIYRSLSCKGTVCIIHELKAKIFHLEEEEGKRAGNSVISV